MCNSGPHTSDAPQAQRDNAKEVALVLRARIEIVLSGVLAVATILTAVWPDWIEGLTGWDPDHGNGQAEWLIVVALAVVTVAVATLARRDLRIGRRRMSVEAS